MYKFYSPAFLSFLLFSTLFAVAKPKPAPAAATPPVTTTLVYDFNLKRLGVWNATNKTIGPLPEKVKADDKLVVKVIHVNRYLYQVGVTVNEEEFKSQAPALLAGLFSPSGDIAATLAKLTTGVGGSSTGNNPGFAPNAIIFGLSPLTDVADKFKKLIEIEKKASVEALPTYDSHLLNTTPIPTPTFNQVLKDLEKHLQACSNFEQAYYAALANATSPDLIKSLQDIKKVYDDHKFADLFRELAKLQLNLTPDNFEFFTRELIADLDVIHIGVKILPRVAKDSGFFIPLDTDSLNFDMPVRQNKGRLSFSQGLFVSGLVNDEYTYKATLATSNLPNSDTATSYKVVNEGTKFASVGIVAMAHYTWGGDKLRAGFNLGIGIPIDKVLNGQITAGGTLAVSVGGKNKLFFNYGPVVGLVRKISSTYQPNQVFTKDTKAISYTQNLDLRFAFSVTFNFF